MQRQELVGWGTHEHATEISDGRFKDRHRLPARALRPALAASGQEATHLPLNVALREVDFDGFGDRVVELGLLGWGHQTASWGPRTRQPTLRPMT